MSCVRQASAIDLMGDLKISKTKVNVQAKIRNRIKNVHSCSITFNSILMQPAETKPYLLHSKTLKSLSTWILFASVGLKASYSLAHNKKPA